MRRVLRHKCCGFTPLIPASCGPEESKFWGFVNSDDADCLRTCQLEEGESGRKALKTDTGLR